jgi:peptidoglycan hydrolase-like protein with peptidoglycan-binding domain
MFRRGRIGLVLSAILYSLTPLGALLAQEPSNAQRLTSAAETVPTEPGAPLHISSAGVRVLQQRLNALGYGAGPATGSWTAGTARAAASYQATNGLESTGTLTVSLMNALGLQAIMLGRFSKWGNGASEDDGPAASVPLLASPTQIRMVQERLRHLGNDPGPSTGNWSAETASAAARFQAANGLEPTGTLTVVTVHALGISTDFWNHGFGTVGAWDLGPAAKPSDEESVAGGGVPIHVSPGTLKAIREILQPPGQSLTRSGAAGESALTTEMLGSIADQAWPFDPGRLTDRR